MYPVPSHVLHRAARSGNPDPALDSRPSIPDGNDLPAQRLARDNSRAAPARHVGLGPDATLQVTPDLAHLLALGSEVVHLNKRAAPVFSTPAAATPVTPAGIDFNIPQSSWRFVNMSVADLLAEVLQRAIGDGPGDAVPNTTLRPEHRRLDDMAFALKLTPGREHDTLVLRNAGVALTSYFFDYRSLVEEMRDKRPDLAPVSEAWHKELARSAIALAVAVPLGADGEPQFDPRLYDGIVQPVREPFDSYLPLLEWRLGELQQQTFDRQSKQYFDSVVVPIVREAPRDNRVLGAAGNEYAGSEVRAFLAGTVVFRCGEAELIEHLRMVPAGRLKRTSTLHFSWYLGVTVQPAHDVFYPDRASGTTIKQLMWLNLAGVSKRVSVANWEGAHSYSLDDGRTWRPTGARTSPALDDLRADGWKRLMADRWHAHKEGASQASQGTGGR